MPDSENFEGEMLKSCKPTRLAGILACCLLLLVLPSFLQAQVDSGQKASESVRGFVQAFYEWYVPKALAESAVPASDLALKQKSTVFDPALFRALKADSVAQAKVKGMTVGLDFDPFLNTQDPCERYEIGGLTHSGNDYEVEIYGVCSGKRNEKPDVVAELELRNDRWLFVNFRYPNDRDLLTVLKALSASR